MDSYPIRDSHFQWAIGGETDSDKGPADLYPVEPTEPEFTKARQTRVRVPDSQKKNHIRDSYFQWAIGDSNPGQLD